MLFGYIDPGSGSLFIQALIGVIVGGAFIFRNFFWKVIGKITGRKANPTEDAKSTKDDKNSKK